MRKITLSPSLEVEAFQSGAELITIRFSKTVRTEKRTRVEEIAVYREQLLHLKDWLDEIMKDGVIGKGHTTVPESWIDYLAWREAKGLEINKS